MLPSLAMDLFVKELKSVQFYGAHLFPYYDVKNVFHPEATSDNALLVVFEYSFGSNLDFFTYKLFSH